MTTKPAKPLPRVAKKMKVQLWVEKVKQREPQAWIAGREIIKLENRNFPEFKKSIQDQLNEARENNEMNGQFSLIAEVRNVMLTPELERDDNGKAQKGMDGKFQGKPFDIEIQRIVNRILNPVEKIIDKYGVHSKDHRTATIELKPADVLYLAQRMLAHFNEYDIVAPFVPKAYDHFVDLEAEAQATGKKQDSDEDEE